MSRQKSQAKKAARRKARLSRRTGSIDAGPRIESIPSGPRTAVSAWVGPADVRAALIGTSSPSDLTTPMLEIVEGLERFDADLRHRGWTFDAHIAARDFVSWSFWTEDDSVSINVSEYIPIVNAIDEVQDALAEVVWGTPGGGAGFTQHPLRVVLERLDEIEGHPAGAPVPAWASAISVPR